MSGSLILTVQNIILAESCPAVLQSQRASNKCLEFQHTVTLTLLFASLRSELGNDLEAVPVSAVSRVTGGPYPASGPLIVSGFPLLHSVCSKVTAEVRCTAKTKKQPQIITPVYIQHKQYKIRHSFLLLVPRFKLVIASFSP